MNKGERAELKFIATLGCHIGQSIKFSNSPNGFIVNSIEIPTNGTQSKVVLSKFPITITPVAIAAMSDLQLKSFCQSTGIVKAGLFSKSDVYINGKGYSIKSYDGSPPAIVNHTNRIGWEFVAQQIGSSISPLDILVNDYWNKRVNGVIKEDVLNSNVNSPFSSHFRTLEPFLNYFCFDGSGSKKSNHPADYMVEFSDPCNLNTCSIYDRGNYLSHHWSNLCFSMRSKKGMPRDINALSLANTSSIMMWSRNFQGSLRGSLHVRVK